MNQAGEITQLLSEWHGGNDEARSRLIERVYPELQRIAARQLNHESDGLTLQTGDLVQEAFLRLLPHRNQLGDSRAQFFGIAANVMRRVLVDHSRKKKSLKRGGSDSPVALGLLDIPAPDNYPDWLSFDQALEALQEIDPLAAQVVELRFLAELTMDEIAQVVGRGVATVGRSWRFARAWLRTYLRGQHDAGHLA